MTVPLLCAALLAGEIRAEGQPIQWARVHHDGLVHEPDAAGQTGVKVLSWPFCPTYEARCEDYAWVSLGVALDAYSARRNAPHASIKEIVDSSAADMKPLADALARLFAERGVASDAERVGYVQGLVQAVQYALDTSTGFTEYPKYAIEFLVDEQGDCDDAAVAASALLRGLGYPAWFVLWKSAGGDEGHISTAVSRDRGDLATVAIPAGSQPVIVPGTGEKLLHVDATGVIGGCTARCTGLGWNEWYRQNPPLREAVAVRADAADLDQVLNIVAWRSDGTFFPERQQRDRREGAPAAQGEEELVQAPEDRVRAQEQDWEDSTLRRLQRLGEDEASARRYLEARRGDPVGSLTWYALSAVAAAGLCVASASAWIARQRRLALAEKARAKRKGEAF